MKVKVAYSVDIDDVPEKVVEIIDNNRELLESIEESVWNCTRTIKLDTSIEKYAVALELVNGIRTKLASIDHVMSDAGTILEGYYNVKKQEMKPQPKQQAAAVKEVLEEMKERIQAAQQELNDAD